MKCDEVLPKCTACKKRNASCEREAAPRPPRRTRAFRRFQKVELIPTGPIAPPTPKVVDCAAHAALEYFYLRTLPVLRICQPSALWDAVAHSLPQRDEAFRHIAIALGFAQRLETDPKLRGPGQPFVHQALVSYGHAVHSLQACMAPDSTKDIGLHAFASLLLVILESLWRAPSAMLMHLQGGLRITKSLESAPSTFQTVTREVARLLERYRVSCALYQLFAVPNAELPCLDGGVSTTTESTHVAPEDHRDIASQQYEIIGGSIEIWRGIGETVQEDQHAASVDKNLVRLRKRHEGLRERLSTAGELSGGLHLRQFAQAQLQLTELALQFASSPSVDDPDYEDQSFSAVLDTLEEALTNIRSLQGWHGQEPGPFSVGLGAISVLGLIVLQSHSSAVRSRALELLNLCPRREGLWDVEEIRNACDKVDLDSYPSKRNFHQLALRRMYNVFTAT